MPKTRISDSELVTQYRLGDELAFEHLVNRYSSRIYTAIQLIVKDNYVAEDILQETFIKSIKTIKNGNYNEEGKFLPWIMRIARNLAVDHFRKDRRYPTIILEDGSVVFNTLQFSDEPAENKTITKEFHSKLKDLIEELPQNQKDVLVMRHYMGLSFQEIAETTDVSINTALGRMRYALINLRKKMTKYKIAYDQNFYP